MRVLARDQMEIRRIDVGGSRPNLFLIGGLPTVEPTVTFNKER